MMVRWCRHECYYHNTVHRINHFSKEGFETGIFIGAQIAGEKPWPVREYSAVASHRLQDNRVNRD
jgi:hypothetical protein